MPLPIPTNPHPHTTPAHFVTSPQAHNQAPSVSSLILSVIPLYFFLCFFLILNISLCFIVFLVKKIEQYARKTLTTLRRTEFGVKFVLENTLIKRKTYINEEENNLRNFQV